MKNLLLTFFMLTIFSSAFSQSSSNSPLYGTWILQSATFTSGDTVTKDDKSTKKQMKIISPGHFAFIISNAADDKFIMASGGRVIIDGNNYTEIVDYSSEPTSVNATYKFITKIVGDTWYHNGMIDKMKMEEVWKKVK
jgi:hypothetical protein